VLVGTQVDYSIDLPISCEVPDERPGGVDAAGAFSGPA
jgi:hypothetical protein